MCDNMKFDEWRQIQLALIQEYQMKIEQIYRDIEEKRELLIRQTNNPKQATKSSPNRSPQNDELFGELVDLKKDAHPY